MKILVTGSSGFIGGYLVPFLKKKGHDVVECDIEKNYSIFDTKLERELKDCDIVIHLAAQTSVQESIKYPLSTYYTNVLGAIRIAELCIAYAVKLVHISSAAIYDANSSPYAKSKYIVEDILKVFMKEYPITILRLFNVYGDGIKQKPGSIMYRFLNEDKITVNGKGYQLRNYISIKDVVKIIEKSINNKWNGQLVEVGSNDIWSVNDIANFFNKNTGKKIVHKKAVKEVNNSQINIFNLSNFYPYKLETDVRKDIEEMCKKI